MKTLVTLFLITLSSSLFSQTNFRFKINHKLESKDFALNQEASNNLSNPFKVTRLEYYISKISIIHDGGKETSSSAYILANASVETDELIGSFSGIDSVEAIRFSVGVDPFNNNGDPAQWPSEHPLSPKLPSMHWGWQAGYRFVALEGKAGADLSKTFEFHALGNQNYFDIRIPVSSEEDGNDQVITVNADYTKAIMDIDVSSGLIVHGDYDEAAYVLRNFQLNVFSSTTGETNTLATPSFSTGVLHMYPNPASSTVTVDLGGSGVQTGELIIRDIVGQEVHRATIDNTTYSFDLKAPGTYVVEVLTSSGRLTNKLIVQK